MYLLFVCAFALMIKKLELCDNNYSFYPREVVSAVYATATSMAGWLSVTAGIVSKRLNLS